jgi:hypothetical protein
MRRRAGWGAVLVVVGALAWAIPAGAAGKLDVEVLDTDLGQIYDAGKARVSVDPKKAGRAQITLKVTSPGGAETIATKSKKIGRAGATVAAKLTNKGKRALTETCDAEGIRATVHFRFKRGGRVTESQEAEAEQTIATCSQGTEDPFERPYHGPEIPGLDTADRCDLLDPSLCLYPFPNDYFTADDAGSPTGKRLDIDQLSMPQNQGGTPVDVTDYNRADGFSPGGPLVVRIPGLDNPDALEETGGVPLTDLGAYDDPDQAIVLIDADTGERQPIWTEVDSNATSDADRALYIRPAVNLDYGGHYIVALRNLVDSSDDPIAPGLAFRAYRDALITDNPAIEDRRAHMEELFSTLQEAEIPRASLNLAWDFTVASDEGIAGRSLAMRDDAFEELGDTDLDDGTISGDAPDFTVGTVTNFLPCSAGNPAQCEAGESDFFARRVEGTIDTPCYLDQQGCPAGSKFDFDNASDPEPNFDETFRIPAPFTCNIPRPAIDDDIAARPSLYGHGLLGSRNEVNGSSTQTMAFNHNIMYCATDWIGFSSGDQATVAVILGDVSFFPFLVDRTQQSFIDFMYLGRAMIHPDGFADNAAFQVDPDGQGTGDPPHAVFDTSELFYEGNSQGGILGGALTALAPDYERAVLGVPAINYSTLLQRSVDFDEFAGILYPNYPNELERPLLFALMQTLWDRGEPNGYAAHMTSDPLPNTPAHTVLMQVALGDFQVSNYAADVEARTIGAQITSPVTDPGRYWSDSGTPFGIDPIVSYPYTGSAIQYWDGGPVGFTGTQGMGTGLPPLENLPPEPGPVYGADPHSYPRRAAAAQQERSDFFDGAINGCGASPCYSNGYTGPGP